RQLAADRHAPGAAGHRLGSVLGIHSSESLRIVAGLISARRFAHEVDVPRRHAHLDPSALGRPHDACLATEAAVQPDVAGLVELVLLVLARWAERVGTGL